MAFSAESGNYFDHLRSMLQQRTAGALLNPGLDSFGSPEKDLERTSLARLIRGEAMTNGTSVIQSAPSGFHRGFSPESKERRNSNGFDEGGGLGESRRFSGSLGSSNVSSSNISPVSVISGNTEHDEIIVESPAAKVPNGLIHPSLSPMPENHEENSLPPHSPKSERSDSISSEQSFDGSTLQYRLIQQQIIQRQLQQYRLANPSIPSIPGPLPFDRDGGSDAEAEHTSTSPGSSEPRDRQSPPASQTFQCQMCDFSSSSKFHYNSHMNTHQVHRCPVPQCSYSTRTEGRLRRHIKGHHQQPRNPDDPDDLEDSSSHGGGDSFSMGTSQSSNGKQKAIRCKVCHDFVATSKEEHFQHQALHIKPEKQLRCPMDGCFFVTEYKHHLEYHVRNHSGSKPFKCMQPNCNYSCVNKSMLNSHMKSHSNFYQYRCECSYATKYCHSLKLHLKKYNHKATNNGPESAQLTMAASPQEITAESLSKPAEEKPRRRRNVNKNVNNNNNNQTALSNGPRSPASVPPPSFPPGYPPLPMNSGPGVNIPEGIPVGIPPGFPYGLYPSVGGLNQFQAASIYNNLLLSAAAANGMINPLNRMNGMVARNGTVSPEPEIKRDSPSPALSDSQKSSGGNLMEQVGRKHSGVLRMLPQSRVIRSTAELTNGSPLDLSGGKENGSERHSESPRSDGSSGNHTGEVSSSRRRRKGPAFKLDSAVRQRLQDAITEEEEIGFANMEGDEEKCPVIQPQSPPEAFHQAEFRANGIHNGSHEPPKAPTPVTNGRRPAETPSSVIAENGSCKRVKRDRDFFCEYCAMGFEDSTMYSMHMEFHGRDEPYTCELCGHHAGDKVAFFLHIAKAPHF